MTSSCSYSSDSAQAAGQLGLTSYFLAIVFRYQMISKAAVESRPEVGSYRNNTLGLVISCAATLTRRFCPPEMPYLIGVPIKSLA